MSDWGAPWRSGYIPGSHNYANVTNGGVAHLKGSWTEIIASSSLQIDLLCISVQGGNSSTGYNIWKLIDIGIGASGSETVFVANMPDAQEGRAMPHGELWLPCNLPAGTRLSARVQDKIGAIGEVCTVYIECFTRGGWSTPQTTVGVPETYGADVGTSRGAPLVDGTWSEIISLTARNHNGFWIIAVPDDSFAHGDSWVTFEIGIGTSTAEQMVRYMLQFPRSGCFPYMTWHVPFPIPANTRIVCRKTAMIGDASSTFYAVAIGY